MKPVIPAPTHLEKHTTPYTGGKPLLKHEWRGQLCDADRGSHWHIRYYGSLHADHPHLIVGGPNGPAVVVAEHPATGDQIVLFDGHRHGYDGMFVEWTEVTGDRTPATQYMDKDGEQLFSVVISVYNGNALEDAELDIDDDGMATLKDGSRVDADTARRDSFDFLQIVVTNAAGRSTTIVEEELA